VFRDFRQPLFSLRFRYREAASASRSETIASRRPACKVYDCDILAAAFSDLLLHTLI